MMNEISDSLASSECSDTVTSLTHLPSFVTSGRMVRFSRDCDIASIMTDCQTLTIIGISSPVQG